MDAFILAPLLLGAALLASGLSWSFKENINAKIFIVSIRKLLLSGNIARAIKLCYAADCTLARATRAILVWSNKLASAGRDAAQGAIDTLHFKEEERRMLARQSIWRLDLAVWALVFLFGILLQSEPPVWFLVAFGLQALVAVWIEVRSRQMVHDLRSCGSFLVGEIQLLEGAVP